nr:hypothetical protein Iba_chr15eCG0190 [Ipomoea batatas]
MPSFLTNSGLSSRKSKDMSTFRSEGPPQLQSKKLEIKPEGRHRRLLELLLSKLQSPPYVRSEGGKKEEGYDGEAQKRIEDDENNVGRKDLLHHFHHCYGNMVRGGRGRSMRSNEVVAGDAIAGSGTRG